eukprot:SAG25_NODE_709_length_5824_cov_4.561048_5_plen_133_part_00
MAVRRRGDRPALGGVSLITGGRPQWMARPVHAHGGVRPHCGPAAAAATPGHSYSCLAHSFAYVALLAILRWLTLPTLTDCADRARRWHCRDSTIFGSLELCDIRSVLFNEAHCAICERRERAVSILESVHID